MIGCLVRWLTRSLRRHHPHLFDGVLASRSVREAMLEEGFGG